VPAGEELAGGLPIVRCGAGEPLVVLPGLSRTPERSSLAWRGLAHATRREVFVVNRPRGLARGTNMVELAAAHARALASRFDRPVDLLGISTGGAIALQLGVDHPVIVRRMVVAAAASWLGDEGRAKLRAYGDRVAAGRSGAAILASVLASARWQWSATAALWLAEMFESRADPSVMLATIDAEVGFDVTAQLGRVSAPTRLIAGGRDRAFPLPLVRATASGIPGAQLVVYPRAGHLGTMLHRHFGRDVAEFLAAGVTPGERPARR
jgi:pimeloyl-ACP methyl ester carboxylesterase